MNVILYVNVSQLHEASESPSLIRCILTVTLHSGNGVVYLQGLVTYYLFACKDSERRGWKRRGGERERAQEEGVAGCSPLFVVYLSGQLKVFYIVEFRKIS